MPGLSNRNPVAGYGNIGQVHIRYKPKPPPKSKYGAVIFIMCVFLFLFASCWTDPQRRYTFALPPLRMVMISFDKLRYLIYDPTSPKYDNFKVFYDNLGHPLIEGETTLDIVYGQGYTHAQHHLFQIDYLRQKAYGNLSQYEGQSRLSSDLLVRAVGLSELAENDLKYQSEMDMEILQRYADGINAYLSEKHPLPLEYTILGITEIQKWEPVHSLCVLRFFALQFSDSWETTLTKHILTQSMRKDSSSWVDLEDVSTSESASNSFTASASESWVLSGALTPNGKPILHTRIVSESSSLPLYVQNTLKTVSKNFHVAGISVLGVPLVLMGRNSDIAWTVSPISTAQNSNTIVVETLKKEPNCKDPDCVWYSRSDDGSWKPVESHLHEIQFRHWNKLSPTSNISNVSFVSIHTDNGLVMHEELFHVSWLAGKGQPGSDVAEYLVARIPSSDLNKSLRISSFLKINSASSWSEFSVALSSTLFPFDWQFLFASTTGDIARSVTGNRY